MESLAETAHRINNSVKRRKCKCWHRPKRINVTLAITLVCCLCVYLTMVPHGQLSIDVSSNLTSFSTARRYLVDVGAAVSNVTSFMTSEYNSLRSSLHGTNKVGVPKVHRPQRNNSDKRMTLKNSIGAGRTGNQMFQVASLLGIASYHGYSVLLDKRMKLTSVFDLPHISNFKTINRNSDSVFGESGCCKFDERVKNMNTTTNWTLTGFYQSWKYFSEAEDIVRGAFKLKATLTETARNFINMSMSRDAVSICIHVRRGDFVKSAYKGGYTVAPIDYIKNATDYFRNKYERVHFFVVSDDKKWCEKNLQWANVTISSFKTVGEDMALMAESDHVIVTSGSFGWWGAWLCGGETVYWTGFPGNNTQLGNKTSFEDYYPPHWIGLP